MGRGCERRMEQVEYRWETGASAVWLCRVVFWVSVTGDVKYRFWLINKMANYIFTFRIHLFFIAFVDLSYVSQRGKNRKNEISSVSRTRRQFHDSSYSKWPRLFFTIHLKTVQFPWLRTTTRAARSNERGVRRWKDTTGTENLIKSLYEAE